MQDVDSCIGLFVRVTSMGLHPALSFPFLGSAKRLCTRFAGAHAHRGPPA